MGQLDGGSGNKRYLFTFTLPLSCLMQPSPQPMSRLQDCLHFTDKGLGSGNFSNLTKVTQQDIGQLGLHAKSA